MAGRWRSNIPNLIALLDRETPKALTAAAMVLQNEVKQRLRGGYTTGDFVTGLSMNSVTASAPVKAGGVWSIQVGTNVTYNLFWEIGHHNLFTRKYEHVPKWVPAFEAKRDEMAAVYARYLNGKIAGLGRLPT